jgi:hypothetical protein
MEAPALKAMEVKYLVTVQMDLKETTVGVIFHSVKWIPASMAVLALKVLVLPQAVNAKMDSKGTDVKLIYHSVNLTVVSMEVCALKA